MLTCLRPIGQYSGLRIRFDETKKSHPAASPELAHGDDRSRVWVLGALQV